MTKSSWDLYWIAVDPECHGTGVGRLLLSEVESRARAGGCTHLWVETAGRENYNLRAHSTLRWATRSPAN